MLWASAKRLGEDFASTTQLRVADSLSDRGCEITFITPQVDSGAISVLRESGHTHIPANRSRRTGLGWLTFSRSLKRSLPKAMLDSRFDAALVEWQAVAGCYKALERGGVPWLLVDRSPPVFRSIAGRLQWFEYRRAYRLAAKHGAAGSVLKSPALAEWIDDAGMSIHPVTILEAGVDVSQFIPSEMTEPTTIVYHGRLDEVREVARLVRIGEVLAARGLEFAMLLVGSGDSLTKLQKMALLHPWLKVEGAVPAPEIPPLLATAHIGLFPLPDSEIWRLASPLKIREWAAAGLPMVLSDITPHRSIGERSWVKLVRHNAPMDEWADAVQDLLGRDLAALGKSARLEAEAEFDWQKSSDALYSRLRDLVGG